MSKKQQLKALKKMSTEDAIKSQVNSNDWYTRNHARGVIALLKRNAGKDEEAYSLIIAAHKERYAPASLELAKRAIQECEMNEAHTYFKKALKSFIDTKEDVPEATRKEFAKSLVNFARLNSDLDMLKEYSEADALLIYKPKEKKEEIVTDEEEDYDDLDFGESMTLKLRLPGNSSSDDDSDSEVDFDFDTEDEDGF